MNKRDVEGYKEALEKQVHKDSTKVETEATTAGKAAPLVVSPPEAGPEKKVKIVQEEVSYNDFVKKESVVLDSEADYTAEIRALVGSSSDAVTSYLTELKKKKVIPDFSVMPIGALTNFEHRPGFVTAICDVTGKVINIEIA